MKKKTKKRTIKINFTNFWEGFNPEDNFFTNLLRKKYNVIISEKPDYMFYSIYSKKEENSNIGKKGEILRKFSPNVYYFIKKIYITLKKIFGKEKNLTHKGDYIKIFLGAEYVKPKMDECDWAFSSYFEEEINHPKYMRIPVFILNDYPLKNQGIPPIEKKIDFVKIKREKKKFCNFLYSQEFPPRNKFFKILSKYKQIDAPGICMNNMPPIKEKSSKASRLSKNWVIDKLNFLKDYKFTIAFENAFVPGWTTEKLTHPMLVNSVPIYFGNPSVAKEFNSKSFINFNDFNNMEEFMDFIKKVDNDDKLYEKILKEPWYKNEKLPENFSLERVEKRLEEIFG